LMNRIKMILARMIKMTLARMTLELSQKCGYGRKEIGREDYV
jgi:hypothetical protein